MKQQTFNGIGKTARTLPHRVKKKKERTRCGRVDRPMGRGDGGSNVYKEEKRGVTTFSVKFMGTGEVARPHRLEKILVRSERLQGGSVLLYKGHRRRRNLKFQTNPNRGSKKKTARQPLSPVSEFSQKKEGGKVDQRPRSWPKGRDPETEKKGQMPATWKSRVFRGRKAPVKSFLVNHWNGERREKKGTSTGQQ